MNWKVVEKGSNPGALIKVVGVGGCGGNAVDHMVNSGLENVETISISTDSQTLDASVAEIKHCLGELTNHTTEQTLTNYRNDYLRKTSTLKPQTTLNFGVL